jgi:hypothetical protein
MESHLLACTRAFGRPIPLISYLLPSLLLPHGLALLLLLIAFSMPLLADGLWASLEAGQQQLELQQLPTASAIVMLGGHSPAAGRPGAASAVRRQPVAVNAPPAPRRRVLPPGGDPARL